MFTRVYSNNVLSVALSLSAAAWGLYWLPLRTIESAGLSGAWSVAFFNACPLIVLCPFLAFRFQRVTGHVLPTVLASFFIGVAFTLYANGLVETTVARATLLYYLTPIWSTLIGVIWLSERLTKARLVSIVVALVGLYLLLSGGESARYPMNIGDLYSLFSGIFWAVGIALLNKWSKIPILPLTTLIFVFTTAFSAFFAIFINSDSIPSFQMMVSAFPTAAFWSIVILLPSFSIIFRVSQLLFPGRVAILTMSEVVVAILSAAIFLPEEAMALIHWLGAAAIILAGVIEVAFGHFESRSPG